MAIQKKSLKNARPVKKAVQTKGLADQKISAVQGEKKTSLKAIECCNGNH